MSDIDSANKWLSRMTSIAGEVKSLQEYLTQAGFRNDEIKEIWRPLFDRILNEKRVKRVLVFLSIVMFVTVFCIISNIEKLQWHAAAIGRIAMIKCSPLFDWTVLFRKPCLIDRIGITNINENFVNFTECDLCEVGGNLV